MIGSIALFEFRRLFLSPLAWLVLAIVQVILTLLFYILLSQYLQHPEIFSERGLTEVVIGGYYQSAGFIVLLIMPFLTMRLFSEEMRVGTIRLLLSSPVSVTGIVLGKYLGMLLFMFCLLFMVTLMPAGLILGTQLDYGQFAAAILGLTLLLCSLTAIGLFVSSLFRHPAVAAIATFGLLLMLWTSHIAALDADTTTSSVFHYVSLLVHYNPFTLGIFNLADFSYFLLLTTTFIMLCIWRIDALRTHHWWIPQMKTNPAPVKPVNYRLHSVITLVLLILLPILLAWASNRFTTQFDWTREGRHSLSDTSIRLLDQIPGPVIVTSYVREQGNLREVIRDFVGMFQRQKSDIELHFVNPDSAPDQVRQLGISINGEMVLQYQGRSENLRETDEEAFINALIRLSRSEEKWVAFLEGHGERHPTGQANHDLGEWTKHLLNRGYRIQPLNLAEVTAIPDNTTLLVLAGPQVPLLEGETARLLQYLQQGGNLLWLLDPDDKVIPETLLEFLQIDLPGGTIIDVAGQLIGINDPTVTMITNSLYGQHPALLNFSFTTLFPKATALQVKPDSNWRTTPLLITGDHTWLKAELVDNDFQFNETSDIAGPFSIGLGLERDLVQNGSDGTPVTQQRVVVLGDGDFLSNTYLANSGNLDLGLRLINWLSHDETLIEIPVRTAMDTQLALSSAVAGTIGIFFLLGLPLLLASFGLMIWWRRKRR